MASFTKTFKILLLLLSLLSISSAAHAKKIKVGRNEYNVTSANTVGLAKWQDTGIGVVVPEYVEHSGIRYSVSQVDSKAFYKNNDIVSITLPTCINKLESDAIQECSKLIKVDFYKVNTQKSPSITIGIHAIRDCENLRILKFPDIPIIVKESKRKAKGNVIGSAVLGPIYLAADAIGNHKCPVDNCPNLYSIEFLNEVTPIKGYYFFHKCPNIKEVNYGSKNPAALAKIIPSNTIFKEEILPIIKDMSDLEYAEYSNSKSENNPKGEFELGIAEVETKTNNSREAFTESKLIPSSEDLSTTLSKPKADSDIDSDIPMRNKKTENHFAVVIGNENYDRVAPVQYAEADAKIFAEYCKKTLGMPDNNVRYYKDATSLTIKKALKDIHNISDVYKGNLNLLFYYAGHGIPDEKQNAYLLPVDAESSDLDYCLSISELYESLGELEANSVTVFIDACFSGSKRGEGMIDNVRGVAIKPKAETPSGNVVVFSAATNEESAHPYEEQGHGLFTYFLLRKIKESKGEISLGDLADYVISKVSQRSIVDFRRPQTPTVLHSPEVNASWKIQKLIK